MFGKFCAWVMFGVQNITCFFNCGIYGFCGNYGRGDQNNHQPLIDRKFIDQSQNNNDNCKNNMDFKMGSFFITVNYALNRITKAFYLMDDKTVTTLHVYYLNTSQIVLTFSLNRSIFCAEMEI